MKKTIAILSIAASAFALSSCMGGMPQPIGAVYANVSDPIAVGTSGGARTGTATATSYCGLVAIGDSSIAAAKANGHISTVSSVDVHRENILGIISKYTTVVKGN